MREVLITSTVLILAVLGLRRLCRGKINPRWQYALWLLVVLRLFLPVTFGSSPLSILNLLPEKNSFQTASGKTADNISPFWDNDNSVLQKLALHSKQDNTIPDNAASDNIHITSDNAASDNINITSDNITPDNAEPNAAYQLVTEAGQAAIYSSRQTSVFLLVWIIGMAVVGGYLLIYQIRWKRYLWKNRKRYELQPSYHQLAVYLVKGLPSPCLSGNAIYLTEEMAAEEEQRRHILAHEYCHYKQGDRLWVIVRCLLVILYWFHPFVWVAAYASKQDSELACDEAALRLLGEEERIAYGKTLLSLLSLKTEKQRPIGVVSAMRGKEKGIYERISRIAQKPKYAAAAAAGIMAAAVVLCISVFSGSTQENTVGSQSDSNEAVTNTKSEMLHVQAEKQTKEQIKGQADEQTKEQIKEQTDEEEIYTLLDNYTEKYAPSSFAEAKQVNDFQQAYAEQGEAALEEAFYLLDSANCQDGSILNIYGMYSKQYGCRGIIVYHGIPKKAADGSILMDGNCNQFDWQWTVSGMYQAGSNLSKNKMGNNLVIYEEEEDGAPRSFVWKQPIANTSTKELWELHYFFRYDTESLTCLTFDDALIHVKERLSFQIKPEEKQIEVYDNGNEDERKQREETFLAGTISYASLLEESDAEENTGNKKIVEALLDENVLGYFLGETEEELTLYAAIGLKIEGEEGIRYQNLQLISFPVTCDFAEGKFKLGAAKVEEAYVNGVK